MSDKIASDDKQAAKGTAVWRDTYNSKARLYTLLAKGFELFGVARQRRRMIDALGLSRGDTVVDLCSGSGQNFADLQRKVGREGRIVGFDISSQMLAIAAKHAKRHGWGNVELVEADVADVVFPPDMCVAISTFGLDIVPDVDSIVMRLAAQMPPGTKLGLLGSQEPKGWPNWLVRFGIWLNSPCDIEREHLSIRPDIAAASLLTEDRRQNFWWGIFYWSVCRKEGGDPAAATEEIGA